MDTFLPHRLLSDSLVLQQRNSSLISLIIISTISSTYPVIRNIFFFALLLKSIDPVYSVLELKCVLSLQTEILKCLSQQEVGFNKFYPGKGQCLENTQPVSISMVYVTRFYLYSEVYEKPLPDKMIWSCY